MLGLLFWNRQKECRGLVVAAADQRYFQRVRLYVEIF